MHEAPHACRCGARCAELEIEATLERVTEPSEIGQYRILFTPGLVIDEELVCAGRIPSKAELSQLITTRLNENRHPQAGEEGS